MAAQEDEERRWGWVGERERVESQRRTGGFEFFSSVPLWLCLCEGRAVLGPNDFRLFIIVFVETVFSNNVSKLKVESRS